MIFRHCLLPELRWRFLPALLLLAATAAAAATPLLLAHHLRRHDDETAKLAGDLEERSAARMRELREEARLFTVQLGFNTLLLPPGQDAGRLFAENRHEAHAAQADAARIAAAKPDNINHLLPFIRHRMNWAPYGGEVILFGIEGEIFIKNPGTQAPIEEAVPDGAVTLGHTIASKTGFTQGSKIEVEGRAFNVHRVLPPRGTIDDITLILPLAEVQAMLGLQGKIGGILALSCECAGESVEVIQGEIDRIVGPGKFTSSLTAISAQARARARRTIAEASGAQMADLKASRAAVRAQMLATGRVVGGVVLSVTALLLLVLGLLDARERQAECALLRAVGVSKGGIALLFLGKALLIAAMGSALGIGAALLLAGGSGPPPMPHWPLVPAAVIALAILATLPSALLAASRDPALTLNES